MADLESDCATLLAELQRVESELRVASGAIATAKEDALAECESRMEQLASSLHMVESQLESQRREAEEEAERARGDHARQLEEAAGERQRAMVEAEARLAEASRDSRDAAERATAHLKEALVRTEAALEKATREASMNSLDADNWRWFQEGRRPGGGIGFEGQPPIGAPGSAEAMLRALHADRRAAEAAAEGVLLDEADGGGGGGGGAGVGGYYAAGQGVTPSFGFAAAAAETPGAFGGGGGGYGGGGYGGYGGYTPSASASVPPRALHFQSAAPASLPHHHPRVQDVKVSEMLASAQAELARTSRPTSAAAATPHRGYGPYGGPADAGPPPADLRHLESGYESYAAASGAPRDRILAARQSVLHMNAASPLVPPGLKRALAKARMRATAASPIVGRGAETRPARFL